MKDFVLENEKILDEWKKSNESHGEFNFAPDGIMYRGDICDYGTWKERNPSEFNKKENISWTDAPLRILFLTKDQNAGAEEAWDVRGEIGNLSVLFHRNLMYLLYGLIMTKCGVKADYNFTNEEALNVYNTYPFARINAKKEAGCSSVSNDTLRYYLERDHQFLKKQILNLSPDIIVCCGYSKNVEDSGNLLLNFLNNHCGLHLERQDENNWLYYDESQNIVAIDNFHLSYCGYSSEDMYSGAIGAYSDFVNAHPTFCLNHRL